MKLLLVLFMIAALVSLGYAHAASCICTTQYDPVCSTTNKDYGNLCQLQCAQETLAYYGKCGSGVSV